MCLSFTSRASDPSPSETLRSEDTFRSSKSQPGRSRREPSSRKMSHQWVSIGGYRLAAGRLREVLIGQKTKKGFRYLGVARVSSTTGLRKRLFSHLRMLRIYDCPFADTPDQVPCGLTEAQMEDCLWVEPSVKAWVEIEPLKEPGRPAHLYVMNFTE